MKKRLMIADLLHLCQVSLLITLVFSQLCFSMETSRSYSELLEEVVLEAGAFRDGYHLFSPGSHVYERVSWPVFPCAEGLDRKEAVPFLIEVIKSDHDWTAAQFIANHSFESHIARCYAAMCLASTKAHQAYPVLADLLQHGAYLGDPNVMEKERFDIRAYAAIGLGILGDPNAAGFLVDTLDSNSPQLRRESFLALARLRDMRVAEVMIEKAGNDETIDQFTFDFGMTSFTGVRFLPELDRRKRVRRYTEFPELGNIYLLKDPYKKVWRHWFKVGRNWTKQRFDRSYSYWKDSEKSRPKGEEPFLRHTFHLTETGVAALPFLIDKIGEGDEELIILVSYVTRGEIKTHATQADALEWWHKNKARWIIPFKDNQ